MDNVIDWLNDKPHASRVSALLVCAILPFVLVTASAFIFPVVSPFVGAIAGAGLFVAIYGYWRTVLSPEKRAELNYKERYSYKQRRGIVGAAAAFWVIALLLFGSFDFMPTFLLGTLNVFVLISLYWFWRASPEEAAEQLAAYEAAQAAKEAEAQAALEEDEIMDGYHEAYDTEDQY